MALKTAVGVYGNIHKSFLLFRLESSIPPSESGRISALWFNRLAQKIRAAKGMYPLLNALTTHGEALTAGRSPFQVASPPPPGG